MRKNMKQLCGLDLLIYSDMAELFSDIFGFRPTAALVARIDALPFHGDNAKHELALQYPKTSKGMKDFLKEAGPEALPRLEAEWERLFQPEGTVAQVGAALSVQERHLLDAELQALYTSYKSTPVFPGGLDYFGNILNLWRDMLRVAVEDLAHSDLPEKDYDMLVAFWQRYLMGWMLEFCTRCEALSITGLYKEALSLLQVYIRHFSLVLFESGPEVGL